MLLREGAASKKCAIVSKKVTHPMDCVHSHSLAGCTAEMCAATISRSPILDHCCIAIVVSTDGTEVLGRREGSGVILLDLDIDFLEEVKLVGGKEVDCCCCCCCCCCMGCSSSSGLCSTASSLILET